MKVIKLLFIIGSIISFLLTGLALYCYFEPFTEAISVYVFLGAGFLFAILGVTLIFLIFYRKEKEKNSDLTNQIQVWSNTTYHINAAGDQAFEDLPVGIVAYDNDYLIKWVNVFFQNQMQVKLQESPLSIISDKLVEACDGTKDKFMINIADKTYDCVHNKPHKIIYFFDVTLREALKQKYQNRTLAMGVLVVDNLDESLKRYDIQEKSKISGEILGDISDYFEKYNCFIQAIDDDRILIICDKESLVAMKNDKFSILVRIRDISKSSHLKSTISIGFASYDVSSMELGKYAFSALELAEKRGGDQAVVNIQGKKIEYIGGQTNALEKNTLVAARLQNSNFKDVTTKASNVLIMAHDFADCDALGAMIGALRLVLSYGVKDVSLVIEPKHLDTTANKIYSYLEDQNAEILNYIVDEEKALSIVGKDTILVVCDTQSPRLVMFPKVCDKATHLAIIDHHRVGTVDFKKEYVDMSYVETYSSSTVELISEMFIFSPEAKISPLEATIMLTGIVVDTNNFTFRTGSRTFEAASTLKEIGADMVRVRKFLRDSYEYEKELAEALINTEIFYNRFAVSILNDENIPDRTLLAKVSDRLLTIEKIDAAFTIAKLGDNIVAVSARSLEGVNVQVIMEEMGGGGHLQSAACQVPDTTIEDVRNTLIDILKRDYGYEGEEKMKIILLADVKGKGKKDDIIEVNNGYGNYLISNNLGLLANDNNLKKLAENQKQAKIEEENRKNLLEKIKSEIDGKSVTIYLKLGADGKAFGHVTSKLICDEFEAQNGIRLDKKKLDLPNDINSIGIYTATITLAKDIVASFEINVIGN